MDAHAADLLKLVIWALAASGSLIAALLMIIAAIARWNGGQILKRMDRQDETMAEIKTLLTSETGLLHESLHHHDVRIVKLEAFKDQVQNTLHFGRRFEDQNGGNND